MRSQLSYHAFQPFGIPLNAVYELNTDISVPQNKAGLLPSCFFEKFSQSPNLLTQT